LKNPKRLIDVVVTQAVPANLSFFSNNFPILWKCDDCGSAIKLQNIQGTMHLHCNCQVAQVLQCGKVNAKENGKLDFRTFNKPKKFGKIRTQSGIKELGF